MPRNGGKKHTPGKKKRGERKKSAATNSDDTCQGNKQKQNDKPSAAEDLECKTEWQSAHIHQKSSIGSKTKDRDKLAGV